MSVLEKGCLQPLCKAEKQETNTNDPGPTDVCPLFTALAASLIHTRLTVPQCIPVLLSCRSPTELN